MFIFKFGEKDDVNNYFFKDKEMYGLSIIGFFFNYKNVLFEYQLGFRK